MANLGSTNIKIHVQGSSVNPDGTVHSADCTYQGDTVFLTVINRETNKLTGCVLGEFDATAVTNIMEQLVNSCGKTECLLSLLECIGGEEAVEDFANRINKGLRG